MKEKALDLRKKLTRLRDDWEELTDEEVTLTNDSQAEYDTIIKDLSEDDLKWIENRFSEWYAQYLDVETKIFIKPCEG